MNAKFENSNSLLLNISQETKTRVIEKLFPNTELCYGDQITYNLTMLRQVCSALSKLCSLNEEEEGGAVEIGGEIALALSGLLEQQLDITIALVHGAAFEKKQTE